MPILSFKTKGLRELLDSPDVAPRRVPSALIRPLRSRLVSLDRAETLTDLRSPPGMRLEPLRGDRRGQHSVRVNDQFRVCFVWTPSGPEGVEFTNYH